MCELDYFVYGMYGLFGALGSYIIYQKTRKRKASPSDPYMMGVIGAMKKDGMEENDPNHRVD